MHIISIQLIPYIHYSWSPQRFYENVNELICRAEPGVLISLCFVLPRKAGLQEIQSWLPISYTK